jgi:hypothetical protein
MIQTEERRVLGEVASAVHRAEQRAWLGRVSCRRGMIAGAAFAIDSEHVLTCAHVVRDAGAEGPGGEVWVDFPAHLPVWG